MAILLVNYLLIKRVRINLIKHKVQNKQFHQACFSWEFALYSFNMCTGYECLYRISPVHAFLVVTDCTYYCTVFQHDIAHRTSTSLWVTCSYIFPSVCKYCSAVLWHDTTYQVHIRVYFGLYSVFDAAVFYMLRYTLLCLYISFCSPYYLALL